MHYLLPRIFLFLTFVYLGLLARAKNIVDAPAYANNISFVENIGQLKDPKGIARGDIDFRVNTGERSSSVNVYISAGMLHYQWIKPADRNRAEVYQMRLKLIGANTTAKAIKEQEGSFYENYYISDLPQGSRAMGYGKVVYKNIYPNIDWVLYSAKGKLKYDFVVHQGGDVRDIKLQFEGDTSLSLEEGRLVAANRYGNITEDAPYAYEAETKRKVRSKFVLKDGVISIAAASHEGTLVIDPEIIWRTYYGGWQGDMGRAITKKPGNGILDCIFVAGGTQSWQNIVLHPDDLRYPGRDTFHAGLYMDGTLDGFLAAYNSNGRQQWACYYGGDKNDIIETMKYGTATSRIYVAGNTNSASDIATPGTHKTVAGGSLSTLLSSYKDGFVASFDTTGVLQWGTYYGGEADESLFGMDLDKDDNVYIVGETSSFFGIATPGVFSERQYGPQRSGAVAKFSPGGQLIWSTYLGEYKQETCRDVVWDGKSSIYVTGHTDDDTCGSSVYPWRDTMIATPGTYMPWPARGCDLSPDPIQDAFLIKFRANDGTREWGTFYDGNPELVIPKPDSGLTVTYDSSSFIGPDGKNIDGLVYMGGSNFVAAFKTNGALYWKQYSRRVSDMFMDVNGSLITTGGCFSQGSMTDTGVLGQAILCDYDTDRQHYYAIGSTKDTGGIGVGLYVEQDTLGDAPPFRIYGDAYIAKYKPVVYDYCFPAFMPPFWSEPFPPKFPLVYPPTLSKEWCLGADHQLWKVGGPNGNYIAQLSDSSGNFEHFTNVGSGSAWPMTCTIPKNLPPGNNYRIRLICVGPLFISLAVPVSLHLRPEVKITNAQIICQGDTLFLMATDTLASTDRYQWVNADSSFIAITRDAYIPQAGLTATNRYIITAISANSCVDFDTVTVTVRPLPTLSNVTNNSPVCAGSELKLSAFADTAGGAIFNWSGPGFNASGQNVSLPSPQLTDAGMYKVRLTKYGCSSEDSTLVVIDTLPSTPDGTSNGPLCHGDTLKLFATGTTPGVTYLWRGPGNFSSTLANPLLLKMNASGSGVYTVTTKLGNCTSVPDSVEVIVPEPVPAPEVSSNSPVKEGDVLRLYANGEPGASYAWVGPDSFSSQEQNPLINEVRISATGVYHVSATVNGCSASASTTVVINGVSEVYFLMFPNPNDGTFRIKATMDKEQVVPIQVLNVAGQLVYETELTSRRRLLDTEIKLPGSLSSGKYHLRLRIDGTYKVIPFVINP